MSPEEIKAIEDKVNWSGYDRENGRKIILKLIAELRKRPHSLPLHNPKKV